MGKRGKQEGTIRERADGRWEARVLLGYHAGKPIRPSFYGKTRKQAQDKISTAVRDFESGGWQPTENPTIEEFLNRWLKDVVKTSVRPRTHESYAYIVNAHIIKALGSKKLRTVTPPMIQGLLSSRLQGGLSPRTVQYIRAVLRRAFGQAMKWGVVSRNVVLLTDPPRIQFKEVQTLDVEQAKALLTALEGHQFEALFTVALAMGLREGEALALRWVDVNFEANELRVRHTLQSLKGKFSLEEPKSARSRRTLTMPDVVAERLRAHWHTQQEDRLGAGDKWEEWNLVFSTRRGRPLEGCRVNRDFKRVLVRANLPKQRFHDLRHACATFLIAQGVSMRTVMDVLGHSQIALTMNTYSHVLPALKNDAASKMNELLTAKRANLIGVKNGVNGSAEAKKPTKSAELLKELEPARGLEPRTC